MSKHVAISPEEAADRLAIRELIEAYAHCADHRDAKGLVNELKAELIKASSTLRARRERQRDSNAGNKRDELTSPHWSSYRQH